MIATRIYNTTRIYVCTISTRKAVHSKFIYWKIGCNAWKPKVLNAFSCSVLDIGVLCVYMQGKVNFNIWLRVNNRVLVHDENLGIQLIVCKLNISLIFWSINQ